RVQLPHIALGAIAHRVVHGGARYVDPVVVDDAVLDALRTLTPLAPLHQPHSLDAIDVLRGAFPGVPQIAVFDTAFHRTLPRAEQLLPLPHTWFDQGVRRYGFHGLSYEYLAVALDEQFGVRAHGRVITAHLGSGASLCAMRDCRSVATTMGFSALDGLMMSTRCGTLDPGVVLHLLEAGQLSTEALGHMLYYESGLKGVSGASSDPRVLLACEAAGDMPARDALALYVHRIVREAGALVALLGGLDMLVFTAGIGEHSAVLRERICAALGWLGIAIDPQANADHAQVVSSASSAVTVVVEPTNEAWIAARAAVRVLRANRDA
ncbi:acetate/propionate family kinase, partial [Burkholderia sp. LMG 13014]